MRISLDTFYQLTVYYYDDDGFLDDTRYYYTNTEEEAEELKYKIRRVYHNTRFEIKFGWVA